MLKKILVIKLLISIFIIQCASGDASRKDAHEREAEILRELKLGKAIALKIVQQYPLLKDTQATEYVNKVGKSVALFAGRSDFEYYFGILDTESINAYAAPGGYVFVTKGALLAMENEAQLAGVLAHEIAHVNLKHIIKQMPPPRDTTGIVDRIAAVLSAQGTMVSAAMNQVAEKAVKMLFEEGYKREDERNADISAVNYIAATGYPANALPVFLGILSAETAKKGKKHVYNTHPSPEERIGYINSEISSENLPVNGSDAKKRFIKNTAHLKKIKS